MNSRNYSRRVYAKAINAVLSEPRTPLTKIKRIIPLLGASEGFLQALQRYQLALIQENEEALDEARVLGLTALLDGVVDLALFLSLLPAAQGLKFLPALQGASHSLYLGRISRVFGVDELDLIQPIAKRVLSLYGVRDLIDTLFEAVRREIVKPEKHSKSRVL